MPDRPGVLSFSNTHGLAICLTAVHGLSSLLNRGQHGIIGNSRLGGNVCCLRLKVDVERLDTYYQMISFVANESEVIYLRVSLGRARPRLSSRHSSWTH